MSGYYLIVSQLNGFALDVDGSKLEPGTRIFPWQKHGRDNQQFYDDPSTGTIRSKINNFCLDVENNGLVLKPFQQGDQNQQWERRGAQIANRYNPNEVLDVANSDRNAGATVGKFQSHGGPNQSWNFEFVGGQPPAQQGGGYPSFQASTAYPGYPSGAQSYPSQQSYPPPQQQQRQEFYLVSELNGKVIDIKGASKDAGAQIVMWSKNSPPSKNQRWYTDPQGFIHSALNDMVFHAKSGDNVKMAPYNNDPHYQWRLDGNKVINGHGEVLDICRGNKSDGAEICSYKQHGKENQRWKREF